MHDTGARVLQRHPGTFAAQVRGHVHAAKKHRFDASAGLGDVRRGLEGLVGLDDDVEAGGLAVFVEQIRKIADLLGTLHLREHHGFDIVRALDERLHVRHAVERAKTVDADHPLDTGRAVGSRELCKRGGAGRPLLLWSHRVLEIDADDVRPAVEGLREHVRPRAGGKDEGPPRPKSAVGNAHAGSVTSAGLAALGRARREDHQIDHPIDHQLDSSIDRSPDHHIISSTDSPFHPPPLPDNPSSR